MLIPGKEIIPDDSVIFTDGFLYIINRSHAKGGARYSITVKSLCPEYDKPVSLTDIARDFPDVIKVIHETALSGRVFNYGNHQCDPKAELWEQTGTTIGYA